MLSIIIFLLFSVTNIEGQYLSNNYNSWSPNSQNYPTWNQLIQQNRPSIRGNLLNNDISVLPYGSQIIISLMDVSVQDIAARPLNTIILSGSYRFPIPYEIPYSITQIQANNNNNIQQYSIQARIEKDRQLLYINDQYTSVRLIPIPINPINIIMKKVSTSIINNVYTCQLQPEIGPCYGSIEQYYFNIQLRLCQTFIWGGCGGNQNRFFSRDECERTCSTYRRRINNSKQKWMN